MKKTLIASALLTIISVGYADPDTNAQSLPSPAATTTSTTTTSTTTVPATTATTTAVVIDCQYHIPATTTNIEQSVVTHWAQNATVQAFEFDPVQFDSQLDKLKLCFTDQGWQGFNDALQKSGNINAIKSQKLTVSSQVDGDVKIIPIKDNQWKLTVPMQVVYQNDKEKLTQLLSVDLLVGRKVSGDLGIMQIIATPRTPTTAALGAPAPAQSVPTPVVTTPAATTTTTTTQTTEQ
ncbi:IcmL-like protein (plasmid) [Legionella adelaidensis]|uniref:IcmL-like protein n=1 Tax=Legionella adelaidensis TaxID=45056 RepID=A0A0W0R3K8_9GAMM|nr:DotI/IcmL family type IV secretion protein [Legionella adelaidensis]KTC65648.1 IcmL-like protein [Legionella adelaidensis]VEH85156.1 IcmL-like protein [Legionella adelaidensis]